MNNVPEKINGKRILTPQIRVDQAALKEIGLIVVAFSYLEREWFPTEEAYVAEFEVVGRAKEVEERLIKLGFNVKMMPTDPYFLTNILVDKPDLVVNLVDTVKGKDALQTSVPAILEFENIHYTGTGMTGMVIGNNRHLFKQLMLSHGIPTPQYKYIRDLRSNTPPPFVPPYIVKLNELGGSVGIDNNAVKETADDIKKQVEKLTQEYKMPVLIEKFIDGPEITAVIIDDGASKNVFLAQKIFKTKPDGKHEFTSIESYNQTGSYTYKKVDRELEEKIAPLVTRAFSVVRFSDYAKFDIRLGETDNIPYFIDANPNTALGPSKELPLTEVLDLHGIDFDQVILGLISKHAKDIAKTKKT